MKNLRNDIVGVILAGGQSSRMGQDKALLKCDDLFFVEKITGTLKNSFSEVVISANDKQKYNFLNLNIIEDEFKNCGPLSGIHATLKFMQKDLFVIACDLPLVSTNLIEKILKINTNDSVIFSTSHNHVQPLCGIYKLKTLSTLEKYLLNENHSVLKYINNIRHTIISNDNENINELENINTKEDYLKLIRKD